MIACSYTRASTKAYRTRILYINRNSSWKMKFNLMIHNILHLLQIDSDNFIRSRLECSVIVSATWAPMVV